MFRTALKILKATVGVVSTSPGLLPCLPFPLEVKSLLTDFHLVEEIPFSGGEDGRVVLEETVSGSPECDLTPEVVRFRGPWSALEADASDLRFSLWGNQGFLYRYALFLLERVHGVYSLHACGLWRPERNRLYVVAGGPGSGKTVYLLSALERGLKLFSTETVHFALEADSVRWFMGSLVDNVRLETLTRHFPRFKPQGLSVSGDEAWLGKTAVDLAGYRAESAMLRDPEVILLFPRIEEGLGECRLAVLDDPRLVTRLIFENISQKISEPVILYDRLVLPGLDSAPLAGRRLEASARLAGHPSLRASFSALSDPAHCWGSLLESV